MKHADCLKIVTSIADEYDQVVTRRRLLAAKIDRHAIDRLVAGPWLTRVLDGVYLVGTNRLSQRQLFRCALEFAGPASGLAGHSAAEHRGAARETYGRVTVATTRRHVARRPVVYAPMEDQSPAFVVVRPTVEGRFDVHDGMAVTPMPRTIIETRAFNGPETAKRLWREADYLKLLDLDEVDQALATTRRRGTSYLRELAATVPRVVDHDADIRSRQEIKFLELIRQAGLPTPEVNVPVLLEGSLYVADFLYRDIGLVVELDDPSHRRPVAQGRDRVRDLEFFLSDLDVVRFETHRVDREPRRCMDQLAAAIERQRRRVDAIKTRLPI